jgi:hypothetical protein
VQAHVNAADLRAMMYGIQPACPDPQTEMGIASGGGDI